MNQLKLFISNFSFESEYFYPDIMSIFINFLAIVKKIIYFIYFLKRYLFSQLSQSKQKKYSI